MINKNEIHAKHINENIQTKHVNINENASPD